MERIISNINMMRLFLVFIFISSVKSEGEPYAPALYVFGDSIVDPGNNNNNPHTLAKVNYRPYGIDFPAGPTGRFSNGRNIADLIADLLNIPSPLAINKFHTKDVQTTGFNYASGSSGILDESGSRITGGNLNLRTQVKMFRTTVETYLPRQFNYDEHKLASHLSKSIYLIITGSNDYALNFFNTNLYNTSKIYNPLSFADHLLDELDLRVRDLYKLGARKFVIFEIGPLGCLPSTIGQVKPQTRCVDQINDCVNIYNSKLPYKLKRMSKALKGATFIIAKTYQLFYDVITNPTSYGFVESSKPCCPNQCLPNEVPCKHRNEYVFWDHSHPSVATLRIAAAKCFGETGVSSPMSIRQLARKR